MGSETLKEEGIPPSRGESAKRKADRGGGGGERILLLKRGNLWTWGSLRKRKRRS